MTKCTQRYDPSDFEILDVPPTSSTSLNSILCPVSADEIEIRARHGLIHFDESAGQCQECPEFEASQNSTSRGESVSPGTPLKSWPVAQKTSCQDGADALSFVMPQERDVLQSSCISRNSPSQRRPRKSVDSIRSERPKQVSSGGATGYGMSCPNSTDSLNGNGLAQPECSTVDVASRRTEARKTHGSLQPQADTYPLVNISLLSRHASPAPLLFAPHLPNSFQQQKAPDLDSNTSVTSTGPKMYVAHNPALGNCNHSIPCLRPVTLADFERTDSYVPCKELDSKRDATMNQA